MPVLIAAFAAFAKFNEFLLTPPGQAMATDAHNVVAKILGHFAIHLAPIKDEYSNQVAQ